LANNAELHDLFGNVEFADQIQNSLLCNNFVRRNGIGYRHIVLAFSVFCVATELLCWRPSVNRETAAALSEAMGTESRKNKIWTFLQIPRNLTSGSIG
jgi:hypothetical protein